MGSVYWTSDSFAFLSMAFAAQVCGGMGAGLNSTASLAVLTSHYPEQREDIMGYFEAAVGLGFLLGPLIGAGLYALGGYTLPFYGLSFLYVLLMPMLIYVAGLVQQAEVEQAAEQKQLTADGDKHDYSLLATGAQSDAEKESGDGSDCEVEEEDERRLLLVPYSDHETQGDASSCRLSARGSCRSYKPGTKIELKHLLAEKRFVFGLLGQFFAYFALQFISPVLALRLADFGAKPEENGVLFAIPSLIYVLHMPLISLYTRLISKRAVLMFGFALMALSMLFIGNSTWLMIPESL